MTLEPEQDALDALDLAAGPAWIIDPNAGRVLAANAQGARLMPALATLDSAMPALGRLRDMARGIEPIIASARPLVFWTEAGVQRLECEIAPACGGKALVVRVWTGAAPAAASTENRVDEGPALMDDAATLREIARRIKEGQKALANGSGDAAVPPASAALPRTSAGVPRVEPKTATPHEPELGEPAAPPREPAVKPEAAKDGSSTRRTRSSPGVIATLAHELKTPLSAIAAAAEIMKDQRLGPLENDNYRGYAADIHSNARHALSVIERLLSTGLEVSAAPAPASAGMNFTAVDVNAIAEGCVSTMTPLAAKAGVTITSKLENGLAPLTVDATSLRQMLLNLLTNAVKYARSGDAVTLATWQEKDGALAIAVRDTGPGMSREEIARALGPLHQTRDAPAEDGSMGLGLPLVKSLVEANAGRIAISSGRGRGTSVVLTFPRKRIIPV